MARLSNTQTKAASEWDHFGQRIGNSAGIRFTNQTGTVPPANTACLYNNKLVFSDGTAVKEFILGGVATLSELGTGTGEGKTIALDSGGLVPKKGLPPLTVSECSTLLERDNLTPQGPTLATVTETGKTYAYTGSGWVELLAIGSTDRLTYLDITGTISSGTSIDITASGAQWTKSGSAPYIGDGAYFSGSVKVRILKDGTELRKGVEVSRVSNTQVSFSDDLLSGQTIFIYS